MTFETAGGVLTITAPAALNEAGTYYLAETTAPAGYQLPAEPEYHAISVTKSTTQGWIGEGADKYWGDIHTWGITIDGGASVSVENTPAVTGITKQVAATEYDSEKDLETGYTWAGSASFTGLAPHIESVTALFKVTVTGTPGASLSGYSDKLTDAAGTEKAVTLRPWRTAA